MADPTTLANLHAAQQALEKLGLEQAVNKLKTMDENRVLSLAIRSAPGGFVQEATGRLIDNGSIEKTALIDVMKSQSTATKYPTVHYWESQQQIQDAALRQAIESPTPDAMEGINELDKMLAAVAAEEAAKELERSQKPDRGEIHIIAPSLRKD